MKVFAGILYTTNTHRALGTAVGSSELEAKLKLVDTVVNYLRERIEKSPTPTNPEHTEELEKLRSLVKTYPNEHMAEHVFARLDKEIIPAIAAKVKGIPLLSWKITSAEV